MEDITKVKRNMRLWVIGFVVLIVLVTVGVFYWSVNSRLDQAIDQQQFENLITDEQSLREYYKDQEGFEAHFITAANLIKEDQLNSLLRDLGVFMLPVIALAIAFSYFLSKKLINPVQESYDSKKRFMQDAAHELRNPLGAIDATTQTILEDEEMPKSIRSYLKSIQRQVKQLITLSNDLIYLEEASTARKEDLDINEIIYDVIDQLTHLANQNKVKLIFEAQSEAIFHANLEDMVILIRNLISNAIKYSKEEGGEVKIELSSSGKELHLVVADSGVGMKEEDLEHLGERFFRSNNTSGKAGSGLGLSIVYKIVERYKGKINIESQLGKGTVVDIRMHE